MSDQVIVDEERCAELAIHPGFRGNPVDHVLANEQYGDAVPAVPLPALRIGRAYRDFTGRPPLTLGRPFNDTLDSRRPGLLESYAPGREGVVPPAAGYAIILLKIDRSMGGMQSHVRSEILRRRQELFRS